MRRFKAFCPECGTMVEGHGYEETVGSGKVKWYCVCDLCDRKWQFDTNEADEVRGVKLL